MMRAVADTSVIVASILDGGARQVVCANALETSSAAAAGHAWFDSFSVLTRLPLEVRLSPSDAWRVLASATHGARFLSTAEQNDFQDWLGDVSLAGGAVYDALVGWVAKAADVPLLTRDVRALPIYRALKIEVLFIDT